MKAIGVGLCLGLLVAVGCTMGAGGSSPPIVTPSPSPTTAISADAAVAAALREEPGTDVRVVSATLTLYGAASPNGGVRPASTAVWAVLLTGTFRYPSCGPYTATPHPCPSPASTALILVDAQSGEFVEGQIPGHAVTDGTSGSGPLPTPVPTIAPTMSPGGIESTTQDDLFRLTLRADRAIFRASEAIESIVATLAYTGDQPFDGAGPASGVISFAIRQLDGPLHMEAAMDDVCAPHLIAVGSNLSVPFAKTGGFDGAAPEATFWNGYFADPQLHLPAGRWSISAAFGISSAGCQPPRYALSTSIEIQVLP